MIVAEIRTTDTLIEHHRTGVGEAKPGLVDHGTTRPHAAVSVAAWNSFAVPAPTASTAAGSSGNWSISVPRELRRHDDHGHLQLAPQHRARADQHQQRPTPRHEPAERER